MEVRCTEVEQRNWSRTGRAEVLRREGTDGTSSVFLKQYVDRSGRWHRNLWKFEQLGEAVAQSALKGVVEVPALLGADAELVVNAFQYRELIPMDRLLRQRPAEFRRGFEAVLEKMVEVLQAMGAGKDPGLGGLPTKHRQYGGPNTAVSFKGLDFRNVGLGGQTPGSLDEVVMFDFGRPYYAPVEEGAAKLLVSIGLLNWGRPMRRFLGGPDEALLAVARSHLEPFLDGDAVRAELQLQVSFRTTEVRASGAVENSLKSLGVRTVGRRYFRKLERWCAKHLG